MAVVVRTTLIRFRGNAEPAAIEAGLEAMRGFSKLDGVDVICAGESLDHQAAADGYTHCVVIRFTDARALESFGEDPSHLANVAAMGPLVEGAVMIDVGGGA